MPEPGSTRNPAPHTESHPAPPEHAPPDPPGDDDRGDALAAAMGGLHGTALPLDVGPTTGDAPDDLTDPWPGGLGMHDAWHHTLAVAPVPARPTASTPPL